MPSAATMHGTKIFGGSANTALTGAIARELGVSAGDCRVERFPDGETSVMIEQPVRGDSVFVVQPTSPPVNDNLMELLIFADACRRASAERVIAIIPYFGYARSDRRDALGMPITASLAADLMQCAGISHLVLLDVHAPQIEGFFRGPVDNLTAVPVLCDALSGHLASDTVVVSPDAGRVKTATEYARRLGAPLVLLHKERGGSRETSVTHVVGDVKDRSCLIIDDMISTGGTIAESARALMRAGARGEVVVAATHGVLLEGACEQMADAGVARVYVTDSIAHTERNWKHVEVVSVAPLLAASIRLQIAGVESTS